ncbi:MAG: hypothetical protein CM1200mP30_15930 [Pseudomonadota bacterium]|nr:MAG: hypothetical protein CM1200mP30_15930 [Pseudomonadota bacterium]
MKILFSTRNWNRVFLYLLFICSTFSIAGTEASIAILYLITLIRWIWNRSLTHLENPFLWVTLFFIATTVLSGLFNSYETDHLMALRSNWRLLLPFNSGRNFDRNQFRAVAMDFLRICAFNFFLRNHSVFHRG